MRLSRTPLGLVAAALVALPSAALAQSYVEAAEPLGWTGGGVDFTAGGYCTGTWADCGGAVLASKWAGEPAQPDPFAQFQSALDQIYSVNMAVGGIDVLEGWPELGTQPGFLEGFAPVSHAGLPLTVTNSGVFFVFTGLEFAGESDYVIFSDQNDMMFQQLSTSIFPLSQILEADYSFHFAIENVPASGGGGGPVPSDPSLVPEINGSGFAYIAFILGSLGLWLYSGAGRERETALA